jgi:nitroreductase
MIKQNPKSTERMYFSELVNLRESCRKYDTRAVERDKITRIIESCRLSPSACNSQPWKFVVVDDPILRLEVSKATIGPMLQFNRFCLDAPVMVAIIAEKPTWFAKIGSTIKDKDFYLMDIGIVAEHFCLQAAELGLGTCMIGWFDEKKVSSLLHIPEKKRIPLLISLGYPANTKNRIKIRKNLQEILSFNTY